jgi:dolichol-phosphate mannosyltransferase
MQDIGARRKPLLIIPTYNEADNIGILLRNVSREEAEAHVEVLVVDDGSTDETARIVLDCAAADPRIQLLERGGKMGLGTAYLAGFRHAIEHDFTFALTMDADLSHDPKYIPAIVREALSCDLVIGSRYVAGGGIRNWGVHRRLLSAGANFLARNVLGLVSHDCTSGYRCYRTALLNRLPLDEIRSDGYSFLMEILFHCERTGARIREVPIVFVDRRMGQSKVSRKEILKAIQTLVHLKKLPHRQSGSR